jgi:modification methylase
MKGIIAMTGLIHGDTLHELPRLPAKSVDVIFADPPYNLQLDGDLYRPNLTRVAAVDDDWDKFESFADYDGFTRAWLNQAQRIMRDRSSIWVSGTYHNIFRVGAILQELGFWVLNTITWYKHNAMPNFNGTRLKNDVEFVIWAKRDRDSRYTFNHHLAKQFNDGKQLGSVWQIAACGGSERLKGDAGDKLHPTQKPEELLRRILLISSLPGDVVFDPFLGTGTTAAIARRLHRRYGGIERDARYFAAAQARINAEAPLPADHPDLIVRQPPPRVRFERLLEVGLLRPGQMLHLDSPPRDAAILDSGDLRCGDQTGSIHKLGRLLKGAPTCNGWMHWYYTLPDGTRRPIDDLRQQYLRDPC